MMIKNKVAFFLLAAFSLFSAFTPSASAHNADQSYVYIRVHQDFLSGRFEATFTDLNKALDLNLKDGMNEEDLKSALPKIQEYALSKASFKSSQGAHKVSFTEPAILRQGSLGDFLQLNFKLEGVKEVPETLDIDYGMFFEEISNHSALVIIEYNWKDGIIGNEAIPSLTIGPNSKQQTLSLSKGGTIIQGFWSMIKLGIWHIWIGYDHILFLLALAFPSVLLLISLYGEPSPDANIYLGKWSPAEEFKPAFLKIIKIVTAFTLAHTITLSLAALEIVNLPGRFVESIIALSIALAAIHILWPVALKREWIIAFIFGLFHGFGFAGVLAEKGFEGDYVALTLLGFNIGVEIGQLLIIAIIFPILFLIRNLKIYSWVLIIGTIFLIFASLYWFVERAFELDLPLGGIILRALGML